MITINGSCYNENKKVEYVVNLNVDSFDDICEDKMTYEESDKLIAQEILEKYGFKATRIYVSGAIED